MNTIAIFPISSDEDLRFQLEFNGLVLTGRTLEVLVKERSSNTTKATLAIGSGLTLSGSNIVTARYAKGSMSAWAKTEYTADLVDRSGGLFVRLMAVRIIYDEPGDLVYGVKGNKAFINWSPNQAVVTAIGGIGPDGPPNVLEIGEVETLEPGEDVTVNITGTTPAQVLNIGIPKGDKGDAATISVGDVTTGVPGSDATVGNSGTANDAVLDFTIPAGQAATVNVGGVVTGAPGSGAEVENVGTEADAILDFVIPQGATGDKGWSPQFASVPDGARRVQQVTGWVGGEGTPPATGSYVGPSGLVTDIGDATDNRGEPGAPVAPGTIGTPELADDAVTFAKMQNIATARILGRATASSGDVEELTGAQVATMASAVRFVSQSLSAAEKALVQANIGIGPVLTPTSFGAVADGVTDDVTAIDAMIAALTTGGTVDLQGKSYAYTGNSAHDLPEFTTFENGTFLLTGSAASQHMFNPRGTSTALTYTGGTISAGATSLTNVAGLTSADVGKALFITSGDTIGEPNYYRGEYNFIEAVSGTTVTLENQMRFGYSTSPTVSLVVLKRGVRFKNVRFVGDPTKTQRAITYTRCSDFESEVYGQNVGHYTVCRLGCVRSHISGGGNNARINSDNGLDYFLADGNGNLQNTARVKGFGFRHVHANGAGNGTDFDCSSEAFGFACKDSVLDCHPNVMNFTAKVKQSGIRHGGTFANQPVGFMYQGGGMLNADIEVDGYDTSAAALQLLQHTVDAITMRVSARGATAAATRGVDIQIQKPGGSINFIDAKANLDFMASASSIGLNVDTSGAASGLAIESMILDGMTTGRLAGKSVAIRPNHTLEQIKITGTSRYQVSGGYGAIVNATNASGVQFFLASGIQVRGNSGVIGLSATNCIRSVATGNFISGVGGGAITTNAIVGFTAQTGNDYS